MKKRNGEEKDSGKREGERWRGKRDTGLALGTEAERLVSDHLVRAEAVVELDYLWKTYKYDHYNIIYKVLEKIYEKDNKERE